MEERKFNSYWEYLVRAKRPFARLTNISVTPIILTMLIIKGVSTGQPYFWIASLFAAVMGFQQHRHYWNKWDDKHRKA